MMETRWKRILAIVLTVTLFVTMTGVLTCIITGDRVYAASATVSSDVTQIGSTNLTWELSNGILTISGTGEMPNYNTSSRAPWYDQRSSITSVVVNDGVTKVGNYAFYYCYNVTSVSLPDSLTCIMADAFDNCTKLQEIEIPDNVTDLRASAFKECYKLSSVTIPASLNLINDYTFLDCKNLTSVTFKGETPPSISSDAFKLCNALTNITVPIDAADAYKDVYSSICGTQAVVSVTTGNTTTYCGTIDDAWTAATGKTATITLLDNVTTDNGLIVGDGENITFDGGKYTITFENPGVFMLSDGGKLTIMGGTIEAEATGVLVNGGTLTVTGGTIESKFEIDPDRPEPDLNDLEGAVAVMGGSAVLSGGTFIGTKNAVVLDPEIADYNSLTLLLLNHGTATEPHYAYFDNAGNPIVLEKDQTSLTGTVTVAECNHDAGVCGYPPLDVGTSHKKTCLACGMTWAAEPHTLGADNKCAGCQTQLAAQVEIGGAVSYYDTIDTAWAAAVDHTATITLLTNVTATNKLKIENNQSSTNITLDGGEYTLTRDWGIFEIRGGALTITGGNIKATEEGACSVWIGGGKLTVTDGSIQSTGKRGNGVYVCNDGIVNITGGNIKATEVDACSVWINGGKLTVTGGNIQSTGNWGYGVYVYSNGIVNISGGNIQSTGNQGYGVYVYNDGTVNISGGMFTGEKHAISIKNGRISDLLGHTETTRYAYFDIEGKPIVPEEGQSELIGTVTVGVCNHEGEGVCEYQHIDGTETHTMKCLACGYTGAAANCAYGTEYQHDDTYHWLTCTACGYYEKAETHTLKLAVKANGTVITASDTCDCGYQKDLGTVTLTVPAKLTYNDGQTIAWKASEGLNLFNGAIKAEWQDESGGTEGGQKVYSTDTPIPVAWPVPDPNVYLPFSAGKHSLVITVDVSADSSLTPDRYASCTIPVTINRTELTADMVEPLASVSYNGTPQEPAITIMYKQLMLADGMDYDYTYSSSDFTNAGTITVTITGKGNYTGTVETTYAIKKAPLTITARDQAITYGESITQGVDNVTNAGLCTDDVLESITLTVSTVNVPGGNITPSAAGIKNSGGRDVTGNYEIIYVDGKLTINKADAEITVGTGTYNKIFGDAAFTLDVTDNNTEADVQYEVTEGTDVVSVSNGTVTIQNAGMATITVSLPESSNYNAAESKTITVSVAKKGGYTVSEINKNYYYDKKNAANISLAALLPQNCGTVTYGEPATSGDVTFTAVDVENGVLSYALAKGNIDDEGILTVPVTMRNYEDITVTVKVKLTEQIPVELKEGTEVTLVNNTLTYGESLSNLEFNEAVFVDNDGDTVKGSLAWKEAAAKPNVETTSAVWVFTPDKPEYASLEGMTAIRVNKAVPTVSAAPAVEGGVYNPSRVLEQSDLSGATVTGVDGKTLKGGWSWKSANIIPTVNNSGYVAVFTPTDATNYETVTSTVTVNVTKAIPYIAELPTAAGITYGDTLNVSALSGGTVQYGNGTGQAGSGDGSTETVAGIFTWKESSTRPAVADSGETEYTVVFTPSDTINYETIECSVTLTVQKAVNAPNMPDGTMDVPNSCEKVSDVTLPENWEWKASDQDTVLEVGKAVNAVAVYTGSDKGSYEKETVTITITRASCDHVAGEILYTGEGEKASACELDGLGHRECTKCGTVIETGIVIPALKHNYTDKVTKEPTTESEGVRTYTCSLCGNEYTESIPKLPEETHQHSYTESVTKEPTCTDTGIRTYTCSCGDSYTKTIAALVHHYIGRETKNPTTTAEGVMTYTCDHCGDTYTQSIPKLPGTASGNTSNQENKIPVKGEVISDAKSKAVYTVTQAGKTGGTVSYTKSADNKATSISVPNTVILNGISYKVTSIAQNAFKNNKKLTKVTIGNNITAIGSNAFYGCKKLKNVSMGTNVTTIGTKAFYKCTSLTKITIPAKVNKIGKQAFYGCKKLKTITIKTKKLTNKKVGSKAFKGIHSKATVKVPKSKLKIYKQMLKAKGIGSKVKVKK